MPYGLGVSTCLRVCRLPVRQCQPAPRALRLRTVSRQGGQLIDISGYRISDSETFGVTTVAVNLSVTAPGARQDLGHVRYCTPVCLAALSRLCLRAGLAQWCRVNFWPAIKYAAVSVTGGVACDYVRQCTPKTIRPRRQACGIVGNISLQWRIAVLGTAMALLRAQV
jgi:hypothetical protein